MPRQTEHRAPSHPDAPNGRAHRDTTRVRRLVALCVVTLTATVAYTWNAREVGPPLRPELQPVTRSPLANLHASPPAAVSRTPASTETKRLPAGSQEGRAAASPPSATAGPGPASIAVSAASKGLGGSAPGNHESREQAPVFLVLHTGADLSYRKLAVEYNAGGVTRREASPFHCRAAHFAGGRGVCLSMPNEAVMAFTAILFDANFQTSKTLPLAGFPSRTRVSADGRYAAITVFVSGHSYGTGAFSTETQIIDSVTGRPVVGNLEQMEIWSKGARWQSPDANFWGVTFAQDPNRFYATLSTRGSVYLVEGNIRDNRITVLREGVECPSLSPDNTRIAFKSRVPGNGLPQWRIHVLDLASLSDIPLAETDTVDEQVGWLDNGHVTYTKVDAVKSTSSNVWAVPADGRGAPVLVLRDAGFATTIASR